MEKQELFHYQKLTKFQKDLVDALKEIGFTHDYYFTYKLTRWGQIDISRFEKWSDVLKEVYEQGKDQKLFEIQKVLGINPE